MGNDTIRSLERLFLAMGDTTRLQLLVLVFDCERSVGYLVNNLNVSQPKISRHLAYLRQTGVVSTRRDGKSIYYRIDPNLETVSAAVLACALEAIARDREKETVSLSEKTAADHPPSGADVPVTAGRAELEIFLL